MQDDHGIRMTSSEWLSLFACVFQLMLALVAVTRSTKSPLARPLALLSIDVVIWSGAELLYDLSGSPVFDLVDHLFSPLMTAFALDFVLTFVGRRRTDRPIIIAAFVLSFAVAILGALRDWVGADAWTIALLLVALPEMAIALVRLVLHWQRSADP